MASAIRPDSGSSIGEQACRELVARILASGEFRRATRQREFLLYVVDRQLAGRPDEITETLIGHRVYRRRSTWDSGNDSIVRTEAGTLRKRLERYFAIEGAGEPTILEIPRGGYQPVFRPRQKSPTAAPAPASPSRRQLIWIGGAAVATGAGALIWRRAAAGSREAAPAQSVASVELESSDTRLTVAFQQARSRALNCVYSGDPVGEWYATRPDGGSTVFCVRDLAHQSLGAAALGLHRHTANMLRRFARSAARGRDWCCFWTITKDGVAGPESYTSDQDFGYCLPANFDLLRICRRQHLWTGDPAYLDADFLAFYQHTAVDYPARWDADRDDIMETRERPRVRPSYYRPATHFVTSADLVSAQYCGYMTYAAIQESMGGEGSLSRRVAKEFREKAAALRARFNREWWDSSNRRFYSGKLADGSFAPDAVPECDLYSLLFGIPEDGAKRDAALDGIETHRPEFAGAYSYSPEVLFANGRHERAYARLLEIARPDFFGREVGEVAFAFLGATVGGLMGVTPFAPRATVETLPRLTPAVEWVRVGRLPVIRNEISVQHRGVRETQFTNRAGPAIQWKVAFPTGGAGAPAIEVDGVRRAAILEQRPSGSVITTVVPVATGQSRSARRLS